MRHAISATMMAILMMPAFGAAAAGSDAGRIEEDLCRGITRDGTHRYPLSWWCAEAKVGPGVTRAQAIGAARQAIRRAEAMWLRTLHLEDDLGLSWEIRARGDRVELSYRAARR